jgi:PAS domain S-box-containing protein
MRKIFLDKGVLLQFGTAILIWSAAVVVSNHHIIKLRQNKDVERTYEVLLSLKSIYIDIENIESAKRAFVISGDEKFLNFYQSTLNDIHHLDKQLRFLTADNIEQQKELDQLEPLIAEKVSFINDSISLRREKGFEAAKDFFMTGRGQEILNKIRRVENNLETQEYRLLTQRYNKEIIFSQYTLLILNTGRIIALIIIFMAIVRLFREIAVRRGAEEELLKIQNEIKEAQRFLEAIVENIPNMIFVKDAQELRFVRFNKAGEDLIGISREEMIGKNDYDFFPKEQADFFTKKDRETLDKGETIDIPQETIETKGGQRLLHTKKVTIADENGIPKFLLGISEDVTKMKQAEKKLKETLIELERSNKDLEQFAYVASHDLQEPLRVIASFCQLLEQKYKDQLDDKAQEYIAYAVDGSKRMQTMVDDLLSYAKVGRKSEKTSVNLNKVLQTILMDLAISIEKSHAKIIIPELPSVWANQTQMAQLFQNLLNNALKFRGAKDPVVEISVNKKGEYWEFVVSDNGIGIAEQYFDKIFIIFKQLNSKRVYSGNGIGLALCKKIVESHGGQIWLTSEVDKGASFYFTLPVKR